MDECRWELDGNYEDGDDNWETECGQSFVLIEGTPSENKMKYCCYCGKRLVEEIVVDALLLD